MRRSPAILVLGLLATALAGALVAGAAFSEAGATALESAARPSLAKTAASNVILRRGAFMGGELYSVRRGRRGDSAGTGLGLDSAQKKDRAWLARSAVRRV